MTPTTLRTVAADFITQIRAITPDYDLYQDAGWLYVEQKDDVPGERLRLFHSEWDFPVPVEDGIYGDAIEYETQLDVYTNYRGLPDTKVAEMVSADGRQLWLQLEARMDPTVDGLVFIDPIGFAPEVDEPGHVWGAHQFTVRILLDHTA